MAGCCDLRYLTVWFHDFNPKYCLLGRLRIIIDVHDFTASRVWYEFYEGKFLKMGITPSPTQNGNRKPARSQVGVHKISLATANASSNASTSITTDKLLFYLLCLLMYNKWMNEWKRLKVTFRTTYFPPEKKLSPQSESAGKFWQRFTVQQMQSIPQYSAYKSIIDLTVR